jgi:hypothetical protein
VKKSGIKRLKVVKLLRDSKKDFVRKGGRHLCKRLILIQASNGFWKSFNKTHKLEEIQMKNLIKMKDLTTIEEMVNHIELLSKQLIARWKLLGLITQMKTMQL